MDDNNVSVSIQQRPLALVFWQQSGKVTTAPFSTYGGLGFAIELLTAPKVWEAIKLPEFLKRAMINVLVKAQEAVGRGEESA